MKKKLFLCLSGIIFGAGVVGIVTYAIQTNKKQTLNSIYLQNSLFAEFEKCNKAYFESSPEIAILENEKYIEHAKSLRVPKEYEYIDGLNLFIVNARLAKLYQNNHTDDKAEKYFQAAIAHYNTMMSNITAGLSISNKLDVLNELQKFDAKMKV